MGGNTDKGGSSNAKSNSEIRGLVQDSKKMGDLLRQQGQQLSQLRVCIHTYIHTYIHHPLPIHTVRIYETQT